MSGEESGSATPPVLACLGVLVVVMIAAGWVSGTIAAHRAAQTAADFAALAAATALQAGSADPCVRAGEFATANRAVLVTCVVDGREIEVEVSREGPTLWGRGIVLRAAARAGPATATASRPGLP